MLPRSNEEGRVEPVVAAVSRRRLGEAGWEDRLLTRIAVCAVISRQLNGLLRGDSYVELEADSGNCRGGIGRFGRVVFDRCGNAAGRVSHHAVGEDVGVTRESV